MFRRPTIDQSHYRPPKEEPAQYHTDRWPIVTFSSETKNHCQLKFSLPQNLSKPIPDEQPWD